MISQRETQTSPAGRNQVKDAIETQGRKLAQGQGPIFADVWNILSRLRS